MANQGISNTLEGVATRNHDTVLLVARLLMAFIFIESAWNHSLNVEGFAKTFNNFMLPAEMGVPMAVVACIVEMVGGIALAAGWRIRETAIVMFVFVLVTIFVGHRFWEMEGVPRRLHMIQVKKNVFMLGGFLALFIAGAGRYSVSAWWAARRNGGAASLARQS